MNNRKVILLINGLLMMALSGMSFAQKLGSNYAAKDRFLYGYEESIGNFCVILFSRKKND